MSRGGLTGACPRLPWRAPAPSPARPEPVRSPLAADPPVNPLPALGRTPLAAQPRVFSLSGARGERRPMAGSLPRGPGQSGRKAPSAQTPVLALGLWVGF